MTLTQVLAEYICDLSFDELPSDVVDKTKNCILDTLGCGIFGVKTEAGRRIISAIRDLGAGDDATVWGQTIRASSPNAALINGTTSHSFELDDWGCAGHLGACIVPASMAIAEKEEKSGRDLILAVVIGYEISERIYSGGGRAFDNRGWHSTGACGGFGAAASAGKLLGLNKEEMVWTLGLAGSYTGGIWAFLADGSMSKRFHAGRSAQTGVLSAILARKGLTGPSKILEAEYGGYYPTYVPCAYDLIIVTEGLAEPSKEFRILNSGFKPYSSCRGVHASLDAVLKLKKKHSIEAKDVGTVEIRVERSQKMICGGKNVKTLLSAQMSIPYNVALALLTGGAGPKEYFEKGVTDPELQSLLKRINIIADPTFKRHTAKATIKMRNGESYYYYESEPKGEPSSNPLTNEEVEEKFRHNATYTLTARVADEIADNIRRLEKSDNIVDLCRLLAVQ